MRINVWRPATLPVALSMTVKNSGSSLISTRSSQGWNAARLSGGKSGSQRKRSAASATLDASQSPSPCRLAAAASSSGLRSLCHHSV